MLKWYRLRVENALCNPDSVSEEVVDQFEPGK
jgi:hypothetical protein